MRRKTAIPTLEPCRNSRFFSQRPPPVTVMFIAERSGRNPRLSGGILVPGRGGRCVRRIPSVEHPTKRKVARRLEF